MRPKLITCTGAPRNPVLSTTSPASSWPVTARPITAAAPICGVSTTAEVTYTVPSAPPAMNSHQAGCDQLMVVCVAAETETEKVTMARTTAPAAKDTKAAANGSPRSRPSWALIGACTAMQAPEMTPSSTQKMAIGFTSGPYLTSAATLTEVILSGSRTGAPRLIWSTLSMPSMTLPQTVYCLSRKRASSNTMKNCELALSGLCARAIETTPRTCGSRLNSCLRFG